MAKNIFGLLHTVFGSSGVIEPNATIEVYQAGTTTPVTLYSDSGLSTTAGSSVTADAQGVIPQRWIPDATTLKFVYKDSAGATRYTRDYVHLIFGVTDIANLGSGWASILAAAYANIYATAHTWSAEQTYSANPAITGAAASFAGLQFKTGSVLHWLLTGLDGAEGGANAGGDFVIYGYDDSGTLLGPRFKIKRSNSYVTAGGVYDQTTGSAANVTVDSDGKIMRSTSSEKYKRNIEDLDDKYALQIIKDANEALIHFGSMCEADNPNWNYYGISAERLAKTQPKFVQYRTTRVEAIETDEERTFPVVKDGVLAVETRTVKVPSMRSVPLEKPEVEGVSYSQLVVPLIRAVSILQERLDRLEGGAPKPPPEDICDGEKPYVPDFTLIPEPLAKYAQADETADEFRDRLKLLWQRFGIADGENFPGGGEPLSGDEKIKMREIDILLNSEEGRDAGLLQWLDADESGC